MAASGGEAGGGHARRRVEQRPVEQLLVQPAHPPGVAAPLLQQHTDRVVAPVGPELGRAGQPAQGVRVVLGGQQVGPAHPVQLQPVLEQAQEAVRRGEVGAVVTPDVAAARERGQRVEGRRRPQGGIGAAVHELEQLHGELDVAQSAAAELELAVGVIGTDVLLDAAAHGLDVGDEVGAARGGPHHGRDRLGVGLAQLGVAGHRPGLQQCLELPRLGPPLVVGDVPVEGADQRALPALGPQVRVDGEARLPRDAHHPAREPGGARRRRVRRRRRRRRR